MTHVAAAFALFLTGGTSAAFRRGEPVYFTDLFPVTPSSPDYKTAFQDFLKQKYGWTKKTVSCAIDFTKEGAEKSYNEGLKAAGDKAVRTGWTPADMPASAPPETHTNRHGQTITYCTTAAFIGP